MTRFVKFSEARRALDVLNHRPRYNENAFRKAARAEAKGSAVWAKYMAGRSVGGDLHLLVNLDALPASV